MKGRTNKTVDTITLSEAQLLMLNMSDEDIKMGRIISHDDLDKMDREWLKTIEI